MRDNTIYPLSIHKIKLNKDKRHAKRMYRLDDKEQLTHSRFFIPYNNSRCFIDP